MNTGTASRLKITSVVLVAAVGLVVLWRTTTSSKTEATTPTTPVTIGTIGTIETANDSGDADRRGHERMLDALRTIHEERDRENAYLGERTLRRLRKQLSEANARTSPKTIARLHHDIGMDLLRLGRTEQAIESLLLSHEILAPFPSEDQPPFASQLPYNLGVAYLRLGETANCVARHSTKSCILPIEEDGIHVDQTGSRAAMRWLRTARAQSTDDEALQLSARWLLNIAAMTVGEWPDGLTEAERIAPETFESDVTFPRFTDVARDIGIDTFDLCGGAVAEDLDGDGLLDILSSTWDTDGNLRFYHNRGDGTFEERSSEAGLIGLFGGLNMASADYDGDGDVDILVLRGAWVRGRGGEVPNSLLRNDGGRFVDVTFAAGLGDEHHPTQSAAWADYDLDGDVDVYIGNESVLDRPHPGQLFRNNGDGTFTDVAIDAGVTNDRFAKAVTWGDYDNDRLPDLYISNLGDPNRLYHNRGDGTFEDVGTTSNVSLPLQSFPAWFWDFDNDGNLDLYVSSYDQGQTPQISLGAGHQLGPVVAAYLGEPDVFGRESPRLYRGDGKGGFVDVAAEMGVARLTLPMGANFGDLDNDGYPDFYLGTGYPYYEALIPNIMYWNRGGERFDDVTTAGGFGHLQKGHAVAFVDFDNDGDQDVFEQVGGAYPGDAFGNVLFRNPGFGNHWLAIRLDGVRSNRFGIGARIRVEIKAPGGARVVHRSVNSGGSFGCGSLIQHIGVGDATRVALEVFWPLTGQTQRFTDVPLDRRITVNEDRSALIVHQR